MGGCTSKDPQIRKQSQQTTYKNDRNGTQQGNTNSQQETNRNIHPTIKTDTMIDTLKNQDQKIIKNRQSRIILDQQKEVQLKAKLQLIKARKYEEAGVKQGNAYFQMMKIQKQIQLIKQKVGKSKEEMKKFQERKSTGTLSYG